MGGADGKGDAGVGGGCSGGGMCGGGGGGGQEGKKQEEVGESGWSVEGVGRVV